MSSRSECILEDFTNFSMESALAANLFHFFSVPKLVSDKIVSFINMEAEQKDQLIALESKRLLNFSWKNTAKEIDKMILELVN